MFTGVKGTGLFLSVMAESHMAIAFALSSGNFEYHSFALAYSPLPKYVLPSRKHVLL